MTRGRRSYEPIRSPDERVRGVTFGEDSFSVELMDGRSITAPLAWFPRLLHASPEQLTNWQTCGGGYGIHWPDLDEDISTKGLLRGAPAPVLADLLEMIDEGNLHGEIDPGPPFSDKLR